MSEDWRTVFVVIGIVLLIALALGGCAGTSKKAHPCSAWFDASGNVYVVGNDCPVIIGLPNNSLG